MARRRAATDTAELAAAVLGWYQRELAKPAALPAARWEPVRIGPTWQMRDGHWWLPQLTLGWDVLAWCGVWLQLEPGVPWRFTLEQARLLLWWYALDDAGRFLFKDGVLQRLKGWGKDPFGAALSAAELVGPCRFGGWDGDRPIVVDNPQAWIQTAAVAMEQTKNTMRVFPGLFTPEARHSYRLQILREKIHGQGGRLIEAVTSSPATLEGGRASFTLMNETHLWNGSNQGHEMAAVIERNATKAKDGAARTLAITNAYMPGEDSVAERARDAYELVRAGGALDAGLFYDSLEAPAAAPLTPDDAPAVLEGVRGDSVWLDVPTICRSIVDVRNPPSRSRRFWYNQVVAAEDAWVDPREWDDCAAPDGAGPVDGDEVALFFDGSKSDDATALAACRLSDGLVWAVGCWERPKGAPAGWSVDRDDVNLRVAECFERWQPRVFLADPSPGDDETGERYWDAMIDQWGREYGDRLLVRAGERHAVRWPLSGEAGAHQRDFTQAAEQTLGEIRARQLTHDGGRRLRQHVVNARRRPNRFGVSVGKEHRESARKIDLAVAMIGARMGRRLVLNSERWRKMQQRSASAGRGRVIVL